MLGSRGTIDQAIGIIIARNRCSAKAALVLLRRASQHRKTELRDVATSIVYGVGGDAPRATDAAPGGHLLT